MQIPWKKIINNIPYSLRTKKVLVALLSVVLVSFVTTRGGADPRKIQTAQAQVKTLESTVSASGTVVSENEASLRFTTSGKLAWISPKEGDYVNRGQVIASLDTGDLEKRLKKDLNLYNKARLDFEDTRDSQKDKVITDALKRIAERSQADLDNSVIDVEIRDLTIKFSKLASPISGRVVEKGDFFAGSSVSSTDILFKVADFSKLNFVAEIDETEIGKAVIGQKTNVKLDAYPNAPFKTSLKSIGSKAVATLAGATAYEAKFELDGRKNYLLGMNGEAEIITSEKENVLATPIEAIVDEKYVWVAQNGKYVKREIKTGIESDSDIQITENLKEGERVVVSGFSELGKKNLIQKILGLIFKR